MARLGVAGLSLALMLAPEAAMAQFDSSVGAPELQAAPMVGRGVRMDGPRMDGPRMEGPRMDRPQIDRPQVDRPVMRGPATPGRWSQVPGGWQAYRRPSYGFTLPSYWVSSPFYVSNWSSFGLPRPNEGFGWSRYYDDVVLTDRYGRVYDVRSDVDWSRDARWSGEDYSDSYGYRDQPRERRRGNDGIAGAAVGAVVGGVAGNLIGGTGNRLAGTLIGGGVGAIAGAAIGDAAGKHRRSRDGYRYEGDARRGAGGNYSYDGRWTGSWDGGPERTFDGRFDGDVRTHWSLGHGGGYHQQGGEYGYSADYGYGYGGGNTVTTVIVGASAPVVTRSVSYVTEYVRVPARRVVKRTWKPRPKPVCVC